jgi:hypothetical protein
MTRIPIPPTSDWVPDSPWMAVCLVVPSEQMALFIVTMPDCAEAEPVFLDYQYTANTAEAADFLAGLLNVVHRQELEDLKGDVRDTVDEVNRMFKEKA